MKITVKIAVIISLLVSCKGKNEQMKQEVFRNEELTISLIDKGTWVVETADQVSMYILEGENRAMLIDTGTKCEGLDSIVRQITGKPLYVVLTHNHDDHSGNIRYFDEVYMHPADTLVPGGCFNGKYLWLQDGDSFDLGGRKIEVHLMRGHTPGSVILVDRSIHAAFTGDTFGSGLVWLQLRPIVPVTEYYQSCLRMEQLMKEEKIVKLYVGHYPHVNRTLDLNYIVAMKELAKRLCDGDTAGAEVYPMTGFDIACEKPMSIKNEVTMIVFDSESIKN